MQIKKKTKMSLRGTWQLGAISSYPLQSAQKSAGFPFLSGLGYPINEKLCTFDLNCSNSTPLTIAISIQIQ
jgi:hypothetical protein